MFLTRLISGIVLIAIALVTILAGGPVLFATLLIVSLIGMNELYKATKAEDGKFSPLAYAGYAGAVVYYFLIYFQKDSLAVMALTFTFILIMAVYVFTYPRYQWPQTMAAFFGVFYVAVMLGFILMTRSLSHGIYTVWLIFICAWGCDTLAYCCGRLFGKHKMAPVLSPKKTVEGAVGGVIGAALLGALYAFAIGKMSDAYSQGVPVLEFALISGCGGLISMIGDLGASAIKRNAGIKDYGKLIPGHGGILDRFDSVIITAPIIYFLAKVLIH